MAVQRSKRPHERTLDGEVDADEFRAATGDTEPEAPQPKRPDIAKAAPQYERLDSEPFAQIKEGRCGLVIEGDEAAIRERLNAVGIKSVLRKTGVAVSKRELWPAARAAVPVRIERYRVNGVPERLAAVTIEVMGDGSVRLISPAEYSKGSSVEAVLDRYVRSYADAPAATDACAEVAPTDDSATEKAKTSPLDEVAERIAEESPAAHTHIDDVLRAEQEASDEAEPAPEQASHVAQDQAAAGWGGISRAQADGFVREFVARFPAAPQIVVVSRFDQLPERLQQDARQQNGGESSVKGAFSQRDGRVYIVAGNHRSLADLEATVLHETIGHAGVRRMFGQQWVQQLNKLYIALGGDGGIIGVMLRRGMGDQLSAYYHGIAAARKANPERWTDDLARAVLTEEVLAHIAEQQGRPSLRDRFMTLVGAVRQWLRDMGFARLAGLGESDLLFILSRARAEMRRGDTRIVRDGVQIGPREWVTQDGRAIQKDDPDYAHAVRLAKLLGLEERSGTTVFRFDDAEIERQFADTERAYGGREAFERSRADGRTKLGYRQWVQVRTPAFKAWFGDWEALRAQRRLDAMEPVQVRMPDEWIGLSHAELRQRVADALDAMVRERATVMHPELGEIRVGRAGQRKTVAEGRDPAKLLISADLQNVLPKAVHAVSEAADGQNVLGYAKLLAKVRVGSADLVAVFAVREQSDGHWYYNTVAVQDAQKQTPDESGAATAGPARDATPDGEGHPLLTAVEDFVRRPLKRVNLGSVSKVVDPDTGEPLVVYHGSKRDIGPAFKPSKSRIAGAFFFSSDTSFASSPAYTGYDGQAGNVTPVYLALKNPKAVDSLSFNPMAEALAIEAAKSEGFDGIVVKGDGRYIAFRPEQIKSATGNTGAFDPANPSILASRKGEPLLNALRSRLVGRGGLVDLAGTLYARKASLADGLTPEQFRAALVDRFGEDGVASLEAQGLLNIAQADEADPLAGWYDPESKQAFFVPELIGSADAAVALVLHEVGEHHGLEAMLGPRGWRTLKARIAGLARDGKNDIRAAWDGVIDNYPEFHHLAGVEPGQLIGNDRFMHEVIAKIGETAAGRKSSLWRDLLAAVNRFLLKMGFGRQINKNELADLVAGSLKRVMGGKGPGDGPRGGVSAPMASRPFAMADYMQPGGDGRKAVRTRLAEAFEAVFGGDSAKTFNWWNRTLGSQFHKAKKSPEFAKVYDIANAFIDDVSRFANRAADRALSVGQLRRPGSQMPLRSSSGSAGAWRRGPTHGFYRFADPCRSALSV